MGERSGATSPVMSVRGGGECLILIIFLQARTVTNRGTSKVTAEADQLRHSIQVSLLKRRGGKIKNNGPSSNVSPQQRRQIPTLDGAPRRESWSPFDLRLLLYVN